MATPTRASQEVLEELKEAINKDIENAVQLNGHPLADEIGRIEHHLAEIEATIKRLKSK